MRTPSPISQSPLTAAPGMTEQPVPATVLCPITLLCPMRQWRPRTASAETHPPQLRGVVVAAGDLVQQTDTLDDIEHVTRVTAAAQDKDRMSSHRQWVLD